MDDNKEIFNIALGLSSPWHVSDVEFENNLGTRELHIGLSFTRGNKFRSKDGSLYTAYDTVERTWQHLNFFEQKCNLNASVLKTKG